MRTFLNNSQRDTAFIENNPGEDFFIGFKKWWSNQLGMQKPETISCWKSNFEMVCTIYNDKSISEDANAAKRIYNTHEHG